MASVSMVAVRMLDDILVRRGSSIEECAGPVGLSSHRGLEELRRWMDWDAFAEMLVKIRHRMGDGEHFEDLATDYPRVAPSLVTSIAFKYRFPQTLYYIGARWFGPALFRGTRGHVTYSDDGVI